jgi:hypothetical protein
MATNEVLSNRASITVKEVGNARLIAADLPKLPAEPGVDCENLMGWWKASQVDRSARISDNAVFASGVDTTGRFARMQRISLTSNFSFRRSELPRMSSVPARCRRRSTMAAAIAERHNVDVYRSTLPEREHDSARVASLLYTGGCYPSCGPSVDAQLPQKPGHCLTSLPMLANHLPPFRL